MAAASVEAPEVGGADLSSLEGRDSLGHLTETGGTASRVQFCLRGCPWSSTRVRVKDPSEKN